MKPHLILKDFTGSQTGLDFHEFKSGTTAALSASLAAIAVGEGWAAPTENTSVFHSPLTGETQVMTRAVPLLARMREPEDHADVRNPADLRETKVLEPEETKVDGPEEAKKPKPLNKMSKAELVAHALTLGLELAPDSMTVKDMIAAIEAGDA